MSRVSVPAVTVVHYVDPLCPWSLGLEGTLESLEGSYRDRLRVEYRTGVAVRETKGWLKEHGFVDYDSAAAFNAEIARRTKTRFDEDFLRKTGLESSLPACLAFKAAQLQDEEKARRYLGKMMGAFLVGAEPFSEDALVRLAGESGLDARRLVNDVESKGVKDMVERDAKAMEKDQVTFLDLMVVSADGRTERVGEAFDAAAVEKAIDALIPGLPKYSADGRRK